MIRIAVQTSCTGILISVPLASLPFLCRLQHPSLGESLLQPYWHDESAHGEGMPRAVIW